MNAMFFSRYRLHHRATPSGKHAGDEPRPDSNGAYDAFEFCRFMQDFLQAHPEVVEDQQRGWDIYWNPWMAPRQERPVPDERQAVDEAAEAEANPDRSDSQP